MIKGNNYIEQSESKSKDSKSSIRLNISNKKEEKDNKNIFKYKFKFIIITLVCLLLIGGVIALITYFIKKNRIKKYEEENENKIVEISSEVIENGKENNFMLKVNDLKRILIEEKYNDSIIVEDIQTNNFYYKKANYDIYVISENIIKNNNLYNKIYSVSISIQSECINTNNENCDENKLVDLTVQNNTNLRNLEEINDLKDIPISLCLVNITNNNIITSIICPESLPISKKMEIALNFMKYLNINDKNVDEILNITKNEEIIDDKKYMKERSKIKCNVKDQNSECIKEINKTIDLKGNIISYDEIFNNNKTNDEHNSYISNINIKLIDNTKNIVIYSPENYNIILNKLLSKLKPYLKFEDKLSNIFLSNNSFRNLNLGNQYTIDEENIFSYIQYDGIKLNLFLKNNGGYKTETMGAYSYLKIDNEEKELVNLKHFSNFNKILNKLNYLSKAGNNLSSSLYKNIKDSLNNITAEIIYNIQNLKNEIIYKDLQDIFDSSKKIKIFPYNIIEDFNLLENKLNNILNEIEDIDFTKKIKILNENIYDYIKDLHIIIDNIDNNLKNLTNLLISPKNEITEIANYYLNNTSFSFINIINNCKNILFNYYKNEKELIISKIDLLLEEFENNLNISIEKEMNIINNLYSNLKNKNISIENAKDEDYTKILSYINNANKNAKQILEKIKFKIRKEIKLKDNEYFISNYEIESNNISFNYTINKAINISNKIEKKENIDKIFDQIMINFKKNFTYIKNYMDQKKEEQFPLDEKPLKDNYFTINEQNNITNEIKSLVSSILNKIEKENDFYLDEINKTMEVFIKDNKEYLNNLISELNIIFSEESLEKLSLSYEEAFESSLNKIKNDLIYNELLANNYFNELYNIINNDSKILDILLIYEDPKKTAEKIINDNKRWRDFCHKGKEFPENCWRYDKLQSKDYILNKTKTSSYLEKYFNYKDIIYYSKIYITRIFSEELEIGYKKTIHIIKVLFQKIRNNIKNILENSFIKELYFFKDNIKKIHIFNNRFDNYISDEIFNKKYQIQINEFKFPKIQEIQEDQLYNLEMDIDNINDFCINFKRKICLPEVSGIYHYFNKDIHYCHKLSNNINNLKNISIYSEELNNFIKEFNDFYNLISVKINAYIIKTNELKNNLSLIENKIIDKNITFNYLSSIKNELNLILFQKYENKIINGSYYYYNQNIKERLNNIINDINSKWVNLFDNLKENMNNNKNNFKYSYEELGIMALIYQNLIIKNITKDYFDSIEIHQQYELNNSISYYYNFLLNLFENAKYSIINNIPINKNNFNIILNKRKNEISEEFDKIIKNIYNYKTDALNMENQIEILKNDKMNFFNNNPIIISKNIELSNSLEDIIMNIYQKQEDIKDYKYSIISRLYLEYFDNNKQIEEFYKHLKNNFNINLEKFIEIIEENWIPYQYDIINKIKETLNDFNFEIL